MNVVFLVLDSLRKDKISVYNEDIGFTENLERLAEKGTVFENTVTHSNWSLPSYTSMLTGLYPWDHEATQEKPWLDQEDVEKFERELLQHEMPEEVNKIALTSNTWVTDATGLTEGFDSVENFTGLNAATGRLASKWPWLLDHEKVFKLACLLENRFRSRPANAETLVERTEEILAETEEEFFLFANFSDLRPPYMPPEEYLLKHMEVSFSEISRDTAEMSQEVRESIYNACLDYLDDQIGNIIDMLRNREMFDNTALILISNHGKKMEKLDGDYFTASEDIISVPMVIKSPGLDNRRREELFELKSLYEAILSGFEEGLELPEADYAMGEIEEPDFFKARNLSDRPKIRFIRDKDRKLVREGSTDFGDTMVNLETGQEIDVVKEFGDRMDRIEDIEEEKLLEEKKDYVKDKLEELEYI